MSAGFQRIAIRNYRVLADVDLHLRPVNVLFGPNGAGKSTLLDVFGFLNNCTRMGVDRASVARNQGLGLLSGAAADADSIVVEASTGDAQYQLELRFAGGRIDRLAGERLVVSKGGAARLTVIDRRPGSTDVRTLFADGGEHSFNLASRQPEELVLPRYATDDRAFPEAAHVLDLLSNLRLHVSSAFDLAQLRVFGSKAGPETALSHRGHDLWSVLRNLQGMQLRDDRYSTIIAHMSRAFPGFMGLSIEPTGPGAVYAAVLESGLREPVLARWISDGHMHMLLLLTALFGAKRGYDRVVLFDEPETSLHPWALAVLASAIRIAAQAWNRQVILATHSPVLLSQFGADDILEMTAEGGRARLRRLSEIDDARDLLERYAAGSLYMAQEIGAQSKPEVPSAPGHDD